MLFNTWSYLLFLALAVPLHWALPRRLRVGFLALCSLFFYAVWRWEFCFLIVFSAGVDYLAAHRIAAAREAGQRGKRWLALSLLVNISLLLAFKYTYFVWDNVRVVASAGGHSLPRLQDLGLRIVLPLGISFYTFQTISYSIDVYRGVCEPLRRFVPFFCYVIFWPQLIAGPVLRANEVIPQLQGDRSVTRGDVGAGLALILGGLFKKVVLADSLALSIDEAFQLDPATFSAADVWFTTILFGFQIYFDFSGYSDMAIGSARLLGLRFPDNFNYPYLARSPKEFWGRWHISLSSWIRDYLYLPLTGQKFRTQSTEGLGEAASDQARNAALLGTWLIMGLWHGAAWTFALWGLYHAVLILAYRSLGFLRRLPERFPRGAWALMFLLAMAGWIPFRAESMSQCLELFSKIVNPLDYVPRRPVIDFKAALWAPALVGAMLGAHYVAKLRDAGRIPPRTLWLGSALAHGAMVATILVCMRPVSQFIYFQF